MADYCVQNPTDALLWNSQSNYLITLSVRDEYELNKLIERADRRGIQYTPFREPDLDGSLTAVCFEPSSSTARLMSRLPLALKDYQQGEVRS